jgi:hypothetical protein
MPQAFYILFGACFTTASAWAVGGLLFQLLHLKLRRHEHHLLAFVTGSACLSLMVFLLATVGMVRKGVLLVLGATLIALAIRRRVHRDAGEPFPALPRVWRIVFGAGFLLFGVLYLANAMAPEISADGGAYHLRFVAEYFRAHGFVRITTNMYANLSQGLELLMLFAFVFGRYSSAAMVHFAFLLALPLLMLGYARRRGIPVAGVAGALLTFLSPVVGVDGISAYNDVATACVLFAVFYLLEIWDAERQTALLVPIGLVAGFGYAIKYTAFLGVPFALGWVAWRMLRERRNPIPSLALVSGGVALLAGPWMLKNWIWLGNPFSPFFNSLFPNPYIHVGFEKTYAYFMRHYAGISGYGDLPLALTVKGDALCGLLGPIFLLTPLAIIALRWQAGRRLMLAGVIFGSTYFSNIGTRFLISAVPFFSLALAMAVSLVPGALMVVVLAHGLLSWPDVLKKYCGQYAWRMDRIIWKQALRVESEDHWMGRVNPSYSLARVVEKSVPANAVVLSYNQIAEAYTTRRMLTVYESAFNEVLGDIYWSALSEEYAPTWHLNFRFPPQALRKIRVVQTAGGKPDQWSVSELRVYHGQQELPRAAQWRLRAQPNPWDVQMAFDNSPVTRWKSWQTIEPGMFIEVDFGREQTVDRVLLESSHDQYGIAVKLEGMDAAGRWRTLSLAPEQSNQPIKPGLRRAVIAELKARGVTHLMVWDQDFGADNIRINTQVWGVTLVREFGPVRIYRLP